MPFDFDDLDAPDMFRRKQREDARLRAEAIRKADEQRAAEAKARVDETSRRANESFLRAEYERAGLRPPFTDDRGVPTVSLSMLRWAGWRVEMVGDQATLIAPPARAVPTGRTRADYARDSS
jgi:hypothetical protein